MSQALVVFDSSYGNTKKIAESIYGGISELLTARVVQVKEVNAKDIQEAVIVVVGSPTHGGKPTQEIQSFLKNMKVHMSAKKVAAFDTRFSSRDKNAGLRLLFKMIGYAAEKIGDALVKSGGDQLVNPEGFIVLETEGPLRTGEIERARRWGISLAGSANIRTREDKPVIVPHS